MYENEIVMKADFLNRLVSISLSARLFREWQKASQLGNPPFSERELLTLEACNDFPFTEKDLARLFGLSPSSVNDLVSSLVGEKLLTKPEGSRGKPLTLTKAGLQQLAKMKQAAGRRMEYLFDSLSPDELNSLVPMLDKIGANARRFIETEVFQSIPVV